MIMCSYLSGPWKWRCYGRYVLNSRSRSNATKVLLAHAVEYRYVYTYVAENWRTQTVTQYYGGMFRINVFKCQQIGNRQAD